MKLYKNYGKDAPELIRENPYRLVEEVSGIGFHKADRIAEKMGIDPESSFRIKSGIKYGLLYYAGEGSTYVPQQELCEKVCAMLDVSSELIYENLVEMAFEGEVQLDTLKGQTVVYLYAYYFAEQRVCRNIAGLVHASLKSLSVDIDSMIKMTCGQTGITLSEQQTEAVKSSLTGGVSVITGGPGTGKTTIINTLINIFEQSGFKTAIAAPTGRAAKRITETSGHYASTVHRLLEYYHAADEDTMRFGKNSEDPLDYDVVIVDEASMIDLMLMQGLTDALKEGTQLILVGDYDQLPSVGAGNVLRDLIESEYVHTVMLTEIFRQARESMIVVNAHRINQGEYPFLNGRDKDFFFMERSSEKQIEELLVQLITARLPAYYEGIVPVRDIQLLTPVRKGALGSIALNKVLQQALNPPREDLAERKFGSGFFGKMTKSCRLKTIMKWDGKSAVIFPKDRGFLTVMWDLLKK